MNISSVSAPPPIVPLDAGSPKAQDATVAADKSDAETTHQPPPPPPLPPGQGTRIDQIV